MEESRDQDQLPIYNIKAVSRLVGLLPVTLRAWERRYGLPNPGRGCQGYRLYSEYDLRTLRWLKQQLENGLSISRAVDFLTELRTIDQDPAKNTAAPALEPPVSTAHLQAALGQALVQFDEIGADQIIRQAFAGYAVEQVLLEIVHPTLVEMGNAWHRGELPIAVEHFATQFCLQHLMRMLAESSGPSRPGLMVAGCAPGESHQIGLLSLVLILRLRGWDVKYLGPDLKLERLAEALAPLLPQLLLFTATTPGSAANLLALPEVLAQFAPLRPLVVLGGQAFKFMRLPETIPAVYLDGSLSQTADAIETLMLEALPAV